MLGEPASCIPLRPLIQRALDRAGNVMTIEDLYTFVLTGAVQLWLAPDTLDMYTDGGIEVRTLNTPQGSRMAPSATACMFTELVTYPRVKAIRSMYTAGNMRDAMAMIPRMARWALTQGCTRAEFAASPGWMRVAGGRKFDIMTAFCAAPLTELLDPSDILHTEEVTWDSRKDQARGQ